MTLKEILEDIWNNRKIKDPIKKAKWYLPK